MSNPTGVTDGQIIQESWGDAVVSRVVGIYSNLTAAEADGREDIGAIVTLTDGSVWIKKSETALHWHQLLEAVAPATIIGAGVSAVLKLAGDTDDTEPPMRSYVAFEDGDEAAHDWYLGIGTDPLGSDVVFGIRTGFTDILKLYNSAYTSKGANAAVWLVPEIEHYRNQSETVLAYRQDPDGRHEWYDDEGTIRVRTAGSTLAYHFRIFDAEGTIFAQARDQSDGGSTIDGSPWRGIRSGTAVPDDGDGQDGDIYVRTNATAANRGIYIKDSGSWLLCSEHNG